MAMTSVVVGGGTGFIGSHLCGLLRRFGYNVTIVSRMPGLNRITWHELSEKGLPKGTVAAVNVAGQNVLDPTRRWSSGFAQNIWNSRVNTTEAFVKAIVASANKPEVFVSISGVSLYPPNDNVIYDESFNGENFDYMSNLCIHWEKAAQIPSTESTRLVRIRTGVVIGRKGGMIKSMKIPFWLGVGGKIGEGKQILPWIHIDDVCRLIKFSIENKRVNGVLNGVAPSIITNEEFTKVFSFVMGRPALFTIPAFVIEKLFGKERAALLLSGAKIQPKHTLETGFIYKFPKIIEACREVCSIGAKC